MVGGRRRCEDPGIILLFIFQVITYFLKVSSRSIFPIPMKKILLLLTLSGILLLGGLYAKRKWYDPEQAREKAAMEVEQLTGEHELQTGDIIFQTSRSRQSKAIQHATKSTYSHCGMILKEGDNLVVLEAIQPVQRTPLASWIARGEDGKFVVKRLANSQNILTPEVLTKMRRLAGEYAGKNYDLTFEWSDEKMYCSELVWKLYQRAAGIEVGSLQQLGEFDLTGDLVARIINERYGKKIPTQETVISPAAIFKSKVLKVVREN